MIALDQAGAGARGGVRSADEFGAVLSNGSMSKAWSRHRASRLRGDCELSLEYVDVVGMFFVIGLTSSSTWVLFGTSLQAFRQIAGAMRAFNVVMALLLLLSLYPVLARAWIKGRHDQGRQDQRR